MLENIKSSVLKSKNISPFLVPSEHHSNQNNEKNPLTKTKTLYTFPQYLDGDVCTPEDRNPKDEKYLCKFTKKMYQLKTDTPAVILPLIKTLYYTSEAH